MWREQRSGTYRTSPTPRLVRRRLLLKALQMPEYQHHLQAAIEEEHAAGGMQDAERPYSDVVDRLSVRIGTELLKLIPGMNFIGILNMSAGFINYDSVLNCLYTTWRTYAVYTQPTLLVRVPVLPFSKLT